MVGIERGDLDPEKQHVAAGDDARRAFSRPAARNHAGGGNGSLGLWVRAIDTQSGPIDSKRAVVPNRGTHFLASGSILPEAYTSSHPPHPE